MSEWFVIKLGPSPDNAQQWPSGDIYAGVARGEALAYKRYVILVTGLENAERFTWEDNQGQYLRDSEGWYLGYDGLTWCLKQHSKGLSSYWMPVQNGNIWHLADINPGSNRVVSWDPNQKWPLMSTRTVLQEFDAGNKYALAVELLASSPPKPM